MKKILFFLIPFCTFNFSTISAQTKLSSGLILAGGSGNLSNVKEADILQEIIDLGGTKMNKYKFNVAIGYKFRIQPQNTSHFLDLDVYAGLKRFNLEYSYNGQEITDEGTIFTHRGSSSGCAYYYFAFNPSYNYKIYKNLHIGAGIEPTLYYADGSGKWKFDIPPTLRIGYDFKYFDIAVSYKTGLFNVMKSNKLVSGNLNDFQLQLFIPF